MSKVKGKKVVRPSKSGKTVTNSPASLPPQVPDVDAAAPIIPPDASSVPATVPKKPYWDVGKDSKAYEQAMRILAMRTAGIDDKEIAANLGLTTRTVWNYCYIAGKNGWADSFTNAKDQIEFGIMPKVVRELEAGLDDQTRHVTSGMKVSQQMALKIAEGTVFRSFEAAAGDGTVVNNIIGIRIQTVPGAVTEMRVESGGDTPAYSDAEVDDVG